LDNLENSYDKKSKEKLDNQLNIGGIDGLTFWTRSDQYVSSFLYIYVRDFENEKDSVLTCF